MSHDDCPVANDLARYQGEVDKQAADENAMERMQEAAAKTLTGSVYYQEQTGVPEGWVWEITDEDGHHINGDCMKTSAEAFKALAGAWEAAVADEARSMLNKYRDDA